MFDGLFDADFDKKVFFGVAKTREGFRAQVLSRTKEIFSCSGMKMLNNFLTVRQYVKFQRRDNYGGNTRSIAYVTVYLKQ